MSIHITIKTEANLNLAATKYITMRKFIPVLLALSFIFQGCDMIEYHPYDGRVSGERDINNKNIARIEKACKGKTAIRFAVISDTQRWYDETEDAVKALNKRNDIDFVIHAGDVSDFGLTKEFIWMRDRLNELNTPYVVILGNHDCLANGMDVFHTVFGEVNLSFLAGNTKFVCLNTNALEFDYSHPVPDFEFILNELNDEREEYQKTVMAMHVRPYNEQFNNNIAPVFQHYIKQFRDLQFCINGHDHQLQVEELFDDGVIYYGCPNIAKKKYLAFTINADDTYDYEVVEF